MGIGDLVIDKLVTIVSNNVSNTLDKAKMRKSFKEIKEEIQYKLIDKYGNKVYYNDLDGYLYNKEIANKIIENCFNSTIVDYLGIDQFSSTITNKFLVFFPKYKRYEKEIYNCIYILFELVFNKLNNPLFNKETRIVANIMKEGNENLKRCMISQSQIMAEELHKFKTDICLEINKNASCAGINAERNKVIYSAKNEKGLCESKYYDKVIEVENKYQSKLLLEDAIEQYIKLSSEILIDIASQSNDGIDNNILVNIYSNVALCYSNLGKFEEAFDNIKKCSRFDITSNKKYYYIYALIIFQSSSNEMFEQAYDYLLKALIVDRGYSHAKLLKFAFEAFLNKKDYTEIIDSMECEFNEILIKAEKSDLIADYYKFLGIIQKHYKFYEDALLSFDKSQEFEDDLLNKVNKAFCYYSWALSENDNTRRLLKPRIDYERLNKSIDLLNEIIYCKDEFIKKYYFRQIYPTYISACTFANKANYVGKLNIDVVDFDYETNRNIFFNKSILGTLKDDDKEILDKEDIEFFEICNLIDNNSYAIAINKLIKLIDNKNSEISERYYNLLLHACILSEDVQNYISIRHRIIEKNIECPYLKNYDASYYEIIGDFENSKKIYDEFALRVDNQIDCLSALDFYKKHKYKDESISLIMKIHEKILNNQLNISKLDDFYTNAFSYIYYLNFDVAYDLYMGLDKKQVEEITYYRIESAIYNKIQRFDKLCITFNHLYELEKKPEHKLNEAIAYKLCYKLNESEEVLHVCLKIENVDETTKTKCYVLLNEILILRGKLEEAFDYIQEAKEIHELHPHDIIHQVYMSRAFRCKKNDDAVKHMIDFKKKYPVTTDWVHEIKAIRENKNGEEELTSEIKDILNNTNKKFTTLLKLYKEKKLSIYHLSYFYNTDIGSILTWKEIYNINFNIFSGEIKTLNNEKNFISDEIVLDSLSILMLSKLKSLNILSGFKKIHVTYSSVEMLQQLYIINDFDFIREANRFISTNLNIYFQPNYADDISEEDSLFYPKYLMDSIILSRKFEIPFLYSDIIMLSQLSNYNIKFISIISLLSYLNNIDEFETSDITYNLLKANYEFINFNSFDMLSIIRKNKYKINRELTEPFLNYKSQYDIIGYYTTYYYVLVFLLKECTSCATDYAYIIFEYLDEVMGRTVYYKYIHEKYNNEKHLVIYRRIKEFVEITFKSFYDLLSNEYLKNTDFVLNKVKLRNINIEELINNDDISI